MTETSEEGAVGGLSEEEAKLVNLLRTMHIKPDIDSLEARERLTNALKGKREDGDKKPKPGKHYFPKLSIFYGEDGKGEVAWDTFKYEVRALLDDGSFTKEQIMFGIRRALKGKASDKVRRLGAGVTPEYVIDKLDSDYGSVEDSQTALRKFYMCEQKPTESVESYATRLEELFYKTVELRAFIISDTHILKQSFHSGLRKDLKQMSVYQLDKIRGYDEFKKELRKMESEMKTETLDDKKTCKPAANTNLENSEVTQLLKQLNERIDDLEKGQNKSDNEDVNQQWYSRRGLHTTRSNKSIPI